MERILRSNLPFAVEIWRTGSPSQIKDAATPSRFMIIQPMKSSYSRDIKTPPKLRGVASRTLIPRSRGLRLGLYPVSSHPGSL